MMAGLFANQSETLRELLGLSAPAIAITFSQSRPETVPDFPGTAPAAVDGGRTGKVPAGCVFWGKANGGTFTTQPADHANCNVGSYTHGLKTLEEAAQGSDVAMLLDSGWVTADAVPSIPQVSERFSYITYGPLAEATAAPDVVLLHLNPKQTMLMSDGIPEMRSEGKPQCHIIAVAKEQNQVVASVGCMLSRVRTGMSNNEMTCAIPGPILAEVIARLSSAVQVDKTVAAYASQDSMRFK
ncbi:MAG: hypothetical protein HN394_16115 [Rhodospirillaceae bacterium]|nr:hypothetical protein [Rhodospirillaceae bacterium]